MAKRLAVYTSGGDAPGMNAAVRGVVRAALESDAEVYAIYEGYQGMIQGGSRFRPMGWNSVGGMLHRGGTVIGSARSPEFRTREGRLKAVKNLLEHGIDRLVCIGGDGSLTGANLLRQEWAGLVAELVETGQISQELADKHPFLGIAGLVGSIDNDMYGTDMTIGADTALKRITDAVDAISSTAASHQRAFVVEVMGRRCGHLALWGSIASGADFVLIPEAPPDVDNWEDKMLEILHAGLDQGRRDSIVIVAEGAQDRNGNPITSQYVAQTLSERMGEEVRVTILGHVQRGGSPTAFDRVLSTLMGVYAAETVLEAKPEDEPVLIGIKDNKYVRLPLMECVRMNAEINEALATRQFQRAVELRGSSFEDSFRVFRTLVRSVPHPPKPGQRQLRIAVMNGGGPAPGMNAAVRAAVRLILDKGHVPLGIKRGFRGLITNDIEEMNWMSVSGWTPMGGSELGCSRKIPRDREHYAIARHLEEHQIDAILMIGGWSGYRGCIDLYNERKNYPAFNIPIICVPASINNNLPATEFSIGADTALNSIVEVVDKIKQSAVASNRCFVVEVMGRYCGYLALLSALATGAERAYLHEEGITLADLQRDIKMLDEGFSSGKRLGLLIRNEDANPLYTTQFLAALFEQEGGEKFDVRISVLGHLQQGGDPSAYDRVLAMRMASNAVNFIDGYFAGEEQSEEETPAVCLGFVEDNLIYTPLDQIPRVYDYEHQRPKNQWWLRLRPVVRMLAQPSAGYHRRT